MAVSPGRDAQAKDELAPAEEMTVRVEPQRSWLPAE